MSKDIRKGNRYTPEAHRRAVAAYKARNRDFGRCASCPTPTSAYYCERHAEIRRKQRCERKKGRAYRYAMPAKTFASMTPEERAEMKRLYERRK